jgi:hypothetical protein
MKLFHIHKKNVPVKLGKHAPKHNPNDLKLAKYINYSTFPTPPAIIDWTGGISSWGMMLNDNLGDCTCAAIGHLIQDWTKNASNTEITVPDSAILTAYEAVGGYVPGNESTDNGANMSDVLNYFKNTGVGGHFSLGNATINSQNAQEVAVATWLFGGTYIGIVLPASAQNEVGGLWDVGTNLSGNDAPGSWGGHATAGVYADPTTYQLITWGAPQKYTPAFRNAYFDEEYVIITVDWINSVSNNCPAGFDLDQLKADLPNLA